MMQKSCTGSTRNTLIRPMSRPRGSLQVHVCVEAVELAVANDLRVHYNHCNASSFEDFHCDFDCFSFCLCSLGHTRVRRASPVKGKKLVKFVINVICTKTFKVYQCLMKNTFHLLNQ